MFRNLFRAIFTVVGGIAGYGIAILLRYIIIQTNIVSAKDWTNLQEVALASACVIIFTVLFFLLAPLLNRKSKKVTDNIESDLKSVSTNEILGGTAGLVIGLFIAFLISNVYNYIRIPYLPLALTVVTYFVLGYLGVVIATRKGRDIVNMIARESRSVRNPQEPRRRRRSKGGVEATPKIMDTSVIIDGRIYDIMKTGFIEGVTVIPDFVLVELRHIADSSDSLKRKRGRRGLDVLNKIQDEFGVDIYDTAGEKSLKEIPEVDVKLLKLAQIMNGKVVTNDFNLNKVAGINGVPVLNINELANNLKPVVLPGENMNLFLVKEGKENNQAVAYLDDGTMVVVEDGRRYISKNIDVTVTSVLQTAAGRMIFGRPAARQNGGR
ncbi:MAG: hypothetical protein UHP11_03710 [Anaerovoracaceae bacterium]|nr:hypothetical protein [Anaerovoracaceae bacterium]